MYKIAIMASTDRKPIRLTLRKFRSQSPKNFAFSDPRSALSFLHRNAAFDRIAT
jgi:hypothetical protein